MDNEITINGEVYVKKAGSAKLAPPSKCSHGPTLGCSGCPKPWPQEGDEYWYIDSYGKPKNEKFSYLSDLDINKKRFGNCFKTKEEAQMYSLRIESLSKGFIPKDGEKFWVWDFSEEPNLSYTDERLKHLILPKFRTLEECQEWYDKYGKAWEYLLK